MHVTDVSSLLNFVTVALATAAGGEGDMTTDKLSYLRTVGSGFGPLIYKLRKTASYHQLQEHCKTIWETLEHAPTLPEMIVSFNNNYWSNYLCHYYFFREPANVKLIGINL